MSKSCVVVGGGIAGIASALMLSEKGYDVSIIEQKNELGGLLCSNAPFGDANYFDQGTHLLRFTGIDDLDRLLFPQDDIDHYHVFDHVSSGTYFKGLYTLNGFLSDARLPEEQRNNMWEAFKQRPIPEPYEFESLEHKLIHLYGHDYVETLIRPATEKLFLTPLNQLSPSANNLFGLSRVILGNSDDTRKLKTKAFYDNILAHHELDTHSVGLKSLYPKEQGVGFWIKQLEERLKKNNVTILKGANIEHVQVENKSIKSMTVNGSEILTESIYWTIPLFHLAKLANTPQPASTKPPKLLTSVIINLVVDAPSKIGSFYYQDYDPDNSLFRVTLYDNYNDNQLEGFRVTIEVLSADIPEVNDAYVDDRFNEIIRSGVFDVGTQIIKKNHRIIPKGFPVLTSDFLNAMEGKRTSIQNALDNVILLGKGSGKSWFMNQVLTEVYETIRHGD